MKSVQESQDPGKELPKARITRDWKTYLFWLVPLGAAALAGYFIYTNTSKGPEIHIYFDDASGLEAGDSSVRYHGAVIGQVEDIELTSDQKHADVTVSLEKFASGVACEGSQFWIVKAQVGATQIRGLTTIKSGDYITVAPGNGKSQRKFQGLAEAPVVIPPGDLRIVILAERLGSLSARSPVYYRGVQVGQITTTELGPQSQTVQLTLDIDKAYAPLVRVNSVFWNSGGMDVSFGLSGVDISTQSFKTLVGGGIDFATPDTTQKPAPPGTSFRLYKKPQDAWLAWSPAIELDHDSSPTAAPPDAQPARGGQ